LAAITSIGLMLIGTVTPSLWKTRWKLCGKPVRSHQLRVAECILAIFFHTCQEKNHRVLHRVTPIFY